MKTSKEVGAALRELRLEQGLTTEKVQAASGVPNLGFVETGRASAADMSLVAAALGTTLTRVLHTERTRPTTNLRYLAEAVLNLPDGGSKVERLVEAAVLYAMERSDNNQSAAARILGMERKAFVRRLARARRAAKGKR